MRKVLLSSLIVIASSNLMADCYAKHNLNIPIQHVKITSSKSSNLLDLTKLVANQKITLAIKDPNTGTITYTKEGLFIKKDGFYYQGTSRLQGFSMPNKLVSDACILADINAPEDTMAPRATSLVSLALNLNAGDVPPAYEFSPYDSTTYNHSYTADIIDNYGNKLSLSMYFTRKTTFGVWNVYVYVDYNLIGNGTLTFDYTGKLIESTGLNELSFIIPHSSFEHQTITIALNATQYAQPYKFSTFNQDGYESGDFVQDVVDENGYISKQYTNGANIIFSKIAVYLAS